MDIFIVEHFILLDISLWLASEINFSSRRRRGARISQPRKTMVGGLFPFFVCERRIGEIKNRDTTEVSLSASPTDQSPTGTGQAQHSTARWI
jgi:hypothetical protein